jgi:hypothetical protein
MNVAVVEDRDLLASGVDGLRSVELCEAIARSAGEGRRVSPGHRRGVTGARPRHSSSSAS